MSRADTLTYRGCRCGRIVVAEASPGTEKGMWCPSSEAGVHDFLTPYPF